MPTASLVATPVNVATPLLLVVAVPTLVPSSVKLIASPERSAPVEVLVRVAVRVAVPPENAVPDTLPRVVAVDALTTRLPVPVLAA